MEAALEAQKIIFGPILFQSANTMRKLGILKLGYEKRKNGLSRAELQQEIHCSKYGLDVLLEAAMALGIFTQKKERYYITKVGYLLHADERNLIHMNLMENVLYDGFAHLEESILLGRPEGLKVFGSWQTFYEALPTLPEEAKKSWLEWDHFHSDSAFPDALKKVFATPPETLLDVGGNTGKWAIACCNHNPSTQVGIVDLPRQLKIAEQNIKAHGISNRVRFHPTDMLSSNSRLPEKYDVIWMSQFLACFSEEEIVSILDKTVAVMNAHNTLYILEPFWDLQTAEAAAFSMICISLYFTCFANGNSKMYRSDVMMRCIEKSGLEIYQRTQVGDGHTLLECRKKGGR